MPDASVPRNSPAWHVQNTYALLRQTPMSKEQLIDYLADGFAMRDELIGELNRTIRDLVRLRD